MAWGSRNAILQDNNIYTEAVFAFKMAANMAVNFLPVRKIGYVFHSTEYTWMITKSCWYIFGIEKFNIAIRHDLYVNGLNLIKECYTNYWQHWCQYMDSCP